MHLDFNHLVEFDIEKKIVSIWRIMDDGSKHFYTSIDINKPSEASISDYINVFGTALGESLIFDSQKAQVLFDI